MVIKKITDNISWTGVVDWELRTFHGAEYSTHRGTTYNSFLIEDEKTVLVDTVWQPFGKKFVQNLVSDGSLEKIDSIVANHAEIDHSGALEELMNAIPETPIYCSKNAVKSLPGHHHREWNLIPVKTGERISLGRGELVFIEAPMLHWPDSMFCYLTGQNILFSSDAFGQHLASERLYNNLVDQGELYQEAIKYYANILTPFSPMVKTKIDELIRMGLPVDLICPSHGMLWKDHPLQIVEKYLEWAKNYQEDQVTIVYDTMWNGTARMAGAISSGLQKAREGLTVKLYNISHSDKNDVITEVFKSKAILVGSPTVNQGVLSAVAGFLEEIRGLKFKEKKAAAFGTYGWSGESVKLITARLKEAGFEILSEGIQAVWNPDEEALKKCEAFGQGLAGQLE